jgi:hypothetical protein
LNYDVKSTHIDFAYYVHTEIGDKCFASKINGNLQPLKSILKNGDQVEILTSKKQKPKEGWLGFIVTSKARNKIRQSLKDEKKEIADDGKEILVRKLSSLKVDFNELNLKELLLLYKLDEHTELYFQIAKGKIDLKKIKEIVIKGGSLKFGSITKSIKNSFEALISKVVDYIGLGPFRVNTSKTHLSPALGLNGYTAIAEALKTDTPIIGFGGINIKDVKAILETGIPGIGVSDEITKDFNTIRTFNHLLNASSTDEQRHTFK